jgi:hypothetical protein
MRCVDCGYFSYIGDYPDWSPPPPFPRVLNQRQRDEVQRREFRSPDRLTCSKELQGFSKDKVFDEVLKEWEHPCGGYYPYHPGATTALHFQYEAQEHPLKWAKAAVIISIITLLAVLGLGIWQLLR